MGLSSWFSGLSSGTPFETARVDVVASGKDYREYPTDVWLLRAGGRWLVFSVWSEIVPGERDRREARWYTKGPRGWAEAGRFALGDDVTFCPPVEVGERPLFTWTRRDPRRADGWQVVVASWDPARGTFGEPTIADERSGHGVLRLLAAALPGGVHVVAGQGIGTDDFILTASAGAAYERRVLNAYGSPYAIFGRGGDPLVLWTFDSALQRACMTTGGKVIVARHPTLRGPDDEVEDTVSVQISDDFGASWGPDLVVGRRSTPGLELRALSDGSALLVYAENGTAWGAAFRRFVAGSWTPLPQSAVADRFRRTWARLAAVVEHGGLLCVLDFEVLGCWRDGRSEGVHALPTPPGWEHPSVAMGRNDGANVLLVHSDSGSRIQGERGAIAVSELALRT
ncbi:MAG: hypothetical protein ABJE95_18220 [Byssovorax sp.]